MSDTIKSELLRALKHIPANDETYIDVGMELHAKGFELDTWRNWLGTYVNRFKVANAVDHFWNNFDGVTTTEDYIFKMAALGGFKLKNIPAPIQFETDEVWKQYLESIKKYRGKELIGFRTNIKALNSATLGLRGLIILASAAGLGKTMITLQLSMEILANHPDTLCLFYTLEMTKEKLRHRLAASAAEEAWTDFLLQGTDEKNDKAFAGTNPARQRLALLERKEMPRTAKEILEMVERARQESGCKRILLCLDYIQVWEGALELNQFHDEREADMWCIEQLKMVRDALQEDDAMIVISEINKAATKETRLTNESLMGTIRLSYAADIVLLWQRLTDRELYKYFETNGTGFVTRNPPLRDSVTKNKKIVGEIEEFADAMKDYCKLQNTWPAFIEITKGRDGTTRGDIPVTAYYDKLTVGEGFFRDPAQIKKEEEIKYEQSLESIFG